MENNNDVIESIQRLTRCMKRRSSQMMSDYHGRAQGKTLKLIAQNDGINISDLAALHDIRSSSMSAKIDRLEQDGNIVRARDKKDARITRIYITQKGLEILNKRKLYDKSFKQDFNSCFSEAEKDLFCQMCNRLCNQIEDIISNDRLTYINAAPCHEKNYLPLEEITHNHADDDQQENDDSNQKTS